MSVENLAASVRDRTAMVVNAHGFRDADDRHSYYVQLRRNIRDLHGHNPFVNLRPYTGPGVDNYLLRTIGCSEVLAYGSLPHGTHTKETTRTEWKEQVAAVPRKKPTRWESFWGTKKTEVNYEKVETPWSYEYKIPGLHEFTTLTDVPQDMFVVIYAFSHRGADQYGRSEQPPNFWLATDERTYCEMMDFLKANPASAYDFFTALAGDFKLRDLVLQPAKRTRIKGFTLDNFNVSDDRDKYLKHPEFDAELGG